MWTTRVDDDSKGFTVANAPGGPVSFRTTRTTNGRNWYRVTQGDVSLENEAVEGTPLRVIFEALDAVRAEAVR